MKAYLITGIILITLINAVVLAGVAYNRSEPHTHIIELSGREFRLSHNEKSENSAKILRFATRMPIFVKEEDATNNHDLFLSPLNEQTLALLGLTNLEYPVNTQDENENGNFYKQYQSEVYLALEFNGAEYQRALTIKQRRVDKLLQGAKNDAEAPKEYELTRAKNDLQNERIEASRLFIIDAHKNSDALIQKYKDQMNVFVMKGLVNVSYKNYEKAYTASYAYLLLDQIMLPSEIAKTAQVASNNSFVEESINYTVHIGKRFEPWIARVR